MLDALLGGIPSLAGGLLGIVGASLPQLFEWLRAPSRLREQESQQAHEIKMLELSIKQSESAASGRLEEVRLQAEAVSDVEKQISQTKMVAQASQWVKDLSAAIRPVLTIAVFLIWAFVKWMHIQLAYTTGARFETAVISTWNPEDQAIFACIIAFWFTGRYLNDKRPSRT